MSYKAIPPEMRPGLILKKREDCPYRHSNHIDGIGFIDLCKYQPKEGYLRICKDAVPYANNPGRFSEDCPLEDWEDVQKRIQQQKKKEASNVSGH